MKFIIFQGTGLRILQISSIESLRTLVRERSLKNLWISQVKEKSNFFILPEIQLELINFNHERWNF